MVIGGFMLISKRVERFQNIPEKPDRAILDFSSEESSEAAPGLVRNFTKRSIDKRRHFGNNQDDSEFSETVMKWIQNRFNVILDKNQICCTSGLNDSILNLSHCFLDQEDITLVPSPCNPQINNIGFYSKIHFLPLLKENQYYPNLELLDEIKKKAKIMWINYPNNPTTQMASKEFLKKIIDFGHDNNILIVSDESFSETYFEDAPLSILQLSTDGVVAINSPCKRSSMDGYNIGWIAGDINIIDIIRKFRMHMKLNVPMFLQDAAIAAYSDEKHVELMRENYKIKRNTICNALKDAGYEVDYPTASPFIWLESNNTFKKIQVKNGEDLGQEINGFNPGKGCIRISLYPSIPNCKTFADIIRANPL